MKAYENERINQKYIKLHKNNMKGNIKSSKIRYKKNMDFLRKESFNLLKIYGDYFYKSSIENEENQFLIIKNYNQYNKDFFKIRTKLVDWLIEIHNSFQSNLNALFHCIRLLDLFINNSAFKINKFSLHKIAVCCLYISWKYLEVFPLSLQMVIEKISHNSYNINEMKSLEIEILQTIGWDLIFNSSHEFIKTLFFDLIENNIQNVKDLYLEEILYKLESFSIYISLILLHNENFSFIKIQYLAAASIIIAYKICKNKIVFKSVEAENFLSYWVENLFNETEKENTDFESFLSTIYEYYSIFETLTYIGLNINHTNLLLF